MSPVNLALCLNFEWEPPEIMSVSVGNYLKFLLGLFQMASAEDDITGVQDVSSEDEDYSCEDDLSDTESNLPGNVSGRRGPYSKRKLRGILSVYLLLVTGVFNSLK